MDPQAFASDRGQRLELADKELEPFVRAMLTRWGDDDFDADLLEAAGVLWLEVFQAEAPHADPTRNLAAFQTALHESLLETSEPEAVPEEAQVDRITKWISTYSANDGTHRGTKARGGKFTRWNSMRDNAVRTTHELADGQIRPVGGTFNVGGHDLHYPGEPVGPPEIWINCRCLIQSAARTGDAMSGTTYKIGPEEDVEDNPDIIPGSDVFAMTPDPFPGEEEGDGIHVSENVPSGAVVEWIDESGTTYYGPFDTVENAQRWRESDGAPLNGESNIIEMVEVPEAEPVIAAALSTVDVDTEPIPVEEDEDLVPDEPEDGEELITEIPVHGVLAPEGVSTGDGRKFALGALSTRPLPLPLRYETVSTHGGTTSDVVTVGRIDEAWRDDATDMWRWRGAVVLAKPFAQDVIDGLVDGTVRGISIDGDDAEIEVGEPEGEGDDIMDAILDMMNPGETVFSKMRVAGATIVPIPAFPEAYTALGHEFQEDLTPEQQQAQVAALSACGCAPGEYHTPGDVITLDEPLPADAEIYAAAFTEPDLVFAPGTHDGPGWITHPVPTSRIRNYWTKGKGAAKIKWGVGGDFNRCRTQLAKYVQNPDWLAGLCANMHYEALGYWPATHAGKGNRDDHALLASGAVISPAARLIEVESPVYPAEYFSEPKLDRAYPLKIDRETRRVHGYVSEWGVCHVGITGFCQEVPKSYSDYGYFRKGVVDTDKGEQFVGCLTFGGHAGRNMSMSRASDFYDKPEAVRAYVNVGENAYGVWFAGVIPPEVSDADITAMRAIGAVSGDWREVRGKLELIGVPVVNTPGLPVRQLAASAGRQTVMIGAGALKPDVITAAANMDAEFVAGIIRTTVEEYRHQERLAARAEPARAKVRERRLEAARARTNRG